jgi:hypothetical protein
MPATAKSLGMLNSGREFTAHGDLFLYLVLWVARVGMPNSCCKNLAWFLEWLGA